MQLSLFIAKKNDNAGDGGDVARPAADGAVLSGATAQAEAGEAPGPRTDEAEPAAPEAASAGAERGEVESAPAAPAEVADEAPEAVADAGPLAEEPLELTEVLSAEVSAPADSEFLVLDAMFNPVPAAAEPAVLVEPVADETGPDTAEPDVLGLDVIPEDLPDDLPDNLPDGPLDETLAALSVLPEGAAETAGAPAAGAADVVDSDVAPEVVYAAGEEESPDVVPHAESAALEAGAAASGTHASAAAAPAAAQPLAEALSAQSIQLPEVIMHQPSYPADLTDPAINQNAELVLAKRYLRKGPDGQPVEDIKGMFWRVAIAVARAEAGYARSPYSPETLAREFYGLMTGFKFLPNSPTLMNAGTELGQLAACFVLPVGDSMEEIFASVRDAAMIHKSGGGTGFSFSRLRPEGARVGSTGGIASGPVSFMKIFNTATEQVKQGGTRRGANMGILRVDHPDIERFIRAKETEGELNNFNISVALTEKFMQAVEMGEDYELVPPHDKTLREKRKARDIFQLLVNKAWQSGDPGIIFLDRINRDNPTPAQGDIESTNPCGEQPLLPYEACNLGSINLALMHDPAAEDGVDWEELRRVVHLAVRFLDDVIDVSRYPIDAIDKTVKKNRKIGLGVMGWADLLFQLDVPYNSQEALNLGEKVMRFVHVESKAASKVLAAERGAFGGYEDSVYAGRGEGPYRNATTTTIAPTGTLSIIAGCSSGIEPLFALSFTRNVMDGAKLVESNPYFEAALKDADSYSKTLMEEVSKKGTIAHMDIIPADIRRVFVTAHDVEPVYHLKMQAAFQKHTDNAVSKTVNLPGSATEEDIRHIYWMAYELGCKGVTVYRDGCKSAQVLVVEGDKKPEAAVLGTTRVKERPEVVKGFTQKVKTGFGDMYLTVNELDGKPFEVFATLGKSGQSAMAKAEAVGRLTSLALRSGVSVRAIVEQLEGIGGEHGVFQKKRLLKSIPDAVGWVLRTHYLEGEAAPQENGFSKPGCPECGDVLVFEEGCYLCKGCGYTKCG